MLAVVEVDGGCKLIPPTVADFGIETNAKKLYMFKTGLRIVFNNLHSHCCWFEKPDELLAELTAKCSLGFGGAILGILNWRTAGTVDSGFNGKVDGSMLVIGLVNKSAHSSWGLFSSVVFTGCWFESVGTGWTGVDERERSKRSPVKRSIGPD